jgi:D-sedoheptulose 7-phosphate isomerase
MAPDPAPPMRDWRGNEPLLRELLRATMAGRLGNRAGAATAIVDAAAMLVTCFAGGGKVLVFGNGGSAACAQHLAAELVGRMLFDRPPLPAIALTADTAVLTAIANDFGYAHVFARQVQALGQPGDVALAISTSGRSANVLAAVAAGGARGMRSIGLLGAGNPPLSRAVDVAVSVPSADPGRAQELHLAVQHALCAGVEAALFGVGPVGVGPVAGQAGPDRKAGARGRD